MYQVCGDERPLGRFIRQGVQPIGEKEKLQYEKQDKNLTQDNDPKRLAYRHFLKSVYIETAYFPYRVHGFAAFGRAVFKSKGTLFNLFKRDISHFMFALVMSAVRRMEQSYGGSVETAAVSAEEKADGVEAAGLAEVGVAEDGGVSAGGIAVES